MPQDKQRRPAADARGAVATSTGRGADARHSEEKLKENQRRLGVGPEHKTEAMKKGRRGTFP